MKLDLSWAILHLVIYIRAFIHRVYCPVCDFFTLALHKAAPHPSNCRTLLELALVNGWSILTKTGF